MAERSLAKRLWYGYLHFTFRMIFGGVVVSPAVHRA